VSKITEICYKKETLKGRVTDSFWEENLRSAIWNVTESNMAVSTKKKS
jgi:hypothetical protein